MQVSFTGTVVSLECQLASSTHIDEHGGYPVTVAKTGESILVFLY